MAFRISKREFLGAKVLVISKKNAPEAVSVIHLGVRTSGGCIIQTTELCAHLGST